MSTKLRKDDIYTILKRHFPAKNDFVETDYEVEHKYLQHFGIDTPEALEALVVKHKDYAREVDEAMLQPGEYETVEQLAHRDFGEHTKAVSDYCIANNCYYSLPDLLMVVMDVEFEEKYLAYMDEHYYFERHCLHSAVQAMNTPLAQECSPSSGRVFVLLYVR